MDTLRKHYIFTIFVYQYLPVITKQHPSRWSNQYLSVILVQINVCTVSNSTAGLGRPDVRRPQVLCLPQLHTPGRTRPSVVHW